MNICMFVTTDITNDPRVMKEASTLVQAGHTVHVIGIRRLGNEPLGEIRDGVRMERHDLWHMRFSRWLKARRGLSATQGMFGSATAQLTRSRPTWRSWLIHLLYQAHFVVDITVTFVTFLCAGWRQRADVYHAHDFDALLPTLLIARWRRKPVIYDSHEYWYDERRGEPLCNAIIRMLERTCIPHCTQVLVVNGSIAERMAAHYHIPIPTVLMNVPADVPSQPPAPLRDGQPIQVLYHGGYMAGRGLEPLISAMAMVKEPVHLTLRGYGEVELALKAQVEALGLQSKVAFVPPVPMQELARAASSSHIGVIPYSRQHAEFALPNKIFEYMAAGLSLLTNDLTEFRKMVIGHGIGAVCNTDDPAAIARTIDQLAGDRKRLEEYRQRAWQVYHQYYMWESHRQVLLDVYALLTEHQR